MTGDVHSGGSRLDVALAARIDWSEGERLGRLAAYEILDTPSERDFEDITRIAVQVCGTPVSLISFVDRDRQWFKSARGFDRPETPLDQSICRLRPIA